MIFRFILIAFNVAIVTFLIYYMVDTFQRPPEKSKKIVIILGGLLLLLIPLGVFFRIFVLTPQYFIVYPVAIAMFIYLTKRM
jgi:hypothetical protein